MLGDWHSDAVLLYLSSFRICQCYGEIHSHKFIFFSSIFPSSFRHPSTLGLEYVFQ